MRYLYLFIFLSISTAFSCEEKVSLFGESIYAGDNPEVVFGKVESIWNANSEIYDSLYLRSKSVPTKAKLLIYKDKKEFFSKEIKVEKVNKTSTYKIINLNFKKELVKRNQDFPFTVKFVYEVDGKEYCSQSVRFVVTK